MIRKIIHTHISYSKFYSRGHVRWGNQWCGSFLGSASNIATLVGNMCKITKAMWGWKDFSYIYFLISNKFYWYQKRDTLAHRDCTGVNNLVQKWQESRKTRREENDWFRKTNNQSNKILKKNSLRSGMDI